MWPWKRAKAKVEQLPPSELKVRILDYSAPRWVPVGLAGMCVPGGHWMHCYVCESGPHGWVRCPKCFAEEPASKVIEDWQARCSVKADRQINPPMALTPEVQADLDRQAADVRSGVAFQPGYEAHPTPATETEEDPDA